MRGSSSGAQPVTTSRASSSVEMISMAMPVSRAHARQELAAIGGAAAGLGRDVARRRDALGAILSAQTLSASNVRSIAASDKRAGRGQPSPSRTMREKASMTRNPSPAGRATSRRQLLVPRSSAAIDGAKARGRSAAAGGRLRPRASMLHRFCPVQRSCARALPLRKRRRHFRPFPRCRAASARPHYLERDRAS